MFLDSRAIRPFLFVPAIDDGSPHRHSDTPAGAFEIGLAYRGMIATAAFAANIIVTASV
ncbi:hypothetical protein QSH18_11350 [Xanthomonas sp. NCPPB 2654]|uniref:hypothetical protein n=1 Tax=unclassified Xanthomonas TaxID=2643310 RepID=UPI0021DF48D4|nr:MULTISPECIES: hypothetical protein [unclassified Xanthomonas]MDL5366202.1 hypothetical protein [Xanthomonas sp. NCPPB 2654]UYC19006.1 hypothetical protein NUG20_12440 [Xanthomonas sp. CFBP 8443]